MARHISKKQEARQEVMAWLDKLPADTAAAAVLAGTAALAGFMPPFTRLLMMTGSAAGGGNTGKDSAVDFIEVWKILSPGYAIIDLFGGDEEALRRKNISYDPSLPDADTYLKALGLFCASALEGAMMYNAMKNPEVLTTMIKAPAEILKGVGEIVPG